jgi:hypothetical protein
VVLRMTAIFIKLNFQSASDVPVAISLFLEIAFTYDFLIGASFSLFLSILLLVCKAVDCYQLADLVSFVC